MEGEQIRKKERVTRAYHVRKQGRGCTYVHAVKFH